MATIQKTAIHNQCQAAKPKTHQILDQVSIMTRTMLLENNVNTLLKCLLLAIQAKSLINHSSTATGSQNTGGNNETKGPLTTRPKLEYGPPGRLQRPAGARHN